MNDSEPKGSKMPAGAASALVRRLREAAKSPVSTSSVGRLRRMAGTALGTLRAAQRGGGPGEGLGALDLEAIEKLTTSLGELKGIAMKMGQILSYIDVSLPPETQRLLALLQVQSQQTPFEAIERTLREDLPRAADSILSTLDRSPVASASIGQVHRARRPDNTVVAVKVRHPGIDDAIRADFRAAAIGKVMGSLLAPGADVAQVIEEARERFLEECDYVLEAQRQRNFARWFASHERLDVPAVHDDWSAKRVLSTTWHEGELLDDWLASMPSQDERNAHGQALYEFYVGSLYRHGAFNADPHPGNLLFKAGQRVAILDYGCVREFDRPTVRSLAALSNSVRDDDPQAMRDALVALGARDPGGAGQRFDTTRELLRGFYRPLLEPGSHRVDATTNLALFQMFRTKRDIFNLRLPGKLLFLFRIRFGLYAVLGRLGAEADWRDLESALTDQVLCGG